MIVPCEIAVKSVIPAIKAAIAKQLVEKHGLKQSQAAQLLGISQSAVSKYISHVRGKMIEVEKLKEAKTLIEEMIQMLMENRRQRTDFLEKFCKACLTVRRAGLMCEFCRQTEPRITVEQCQFCLSQECDFNKSLNAKQTEFKG